MARYERRMQDQAAERLEMALAENADGGGRTRWLAGAGIGLATLVAAPVAGALAWSRWSVDHEVHLPPAIDAERRNLQSPIAGRIAYYADDAGRERPLVLIHSINAGASAYEMRPLFEFFRGRRPVYAPDLPGFGFSERSKRVYSPEMYAAAVLDLLREINAGTRGGADVVALSLGSEFAALAAIEQPELVHSLVVISPTGLASRMGMSQPGEGAYRTLSFPLWAQTLYDLLVTRASLRYFLARSFTREPDAGLLEYGYATTHQPGARYAPLYFVSGQLFTPNAIDRLYMRVTQPALVIYDRDGYTTFDALPQLLDERSNWRATRVAPSRGLPHFERLSDTARALTAFWSEAMVPQL
jgi:pimeloyl-ACP methyl ester carboxylesterase